MWMQLLRSLKIQKNTVLDYVGMYCAAYPLKGEKYG